MYYEINVTYNNKHFFATADRSITNKDKLKEVYNTIKEKFPESEGYSVTVSKWETVGRYIDMN